MMSFSVTFVLPKLPVNDFDLSPFPKAQPQLFPYIHATCFPRSLPNFIREASGGSGICNYARIEKNDCSSEKTCQDDKQ